MMRVIVDTPPEEFSVVTLDLAKAHLKVESGDEDGLIRGYVAAAVASIDGPDGWLGRALGRQVLEARFDGFGACPIRLPYPPVRSVLSVRYIDSAGAEQVVPPDQYALAGAELAPAFGVQWPAARWQAEAVRVRYEAGYDETMPVPAPIVVAALLMIGDFYQNRETTDTVPASAMSLLAPLRVWA